MRHFRWQRQLELVVKKGEELEVSSLGSRVELDTVVGNYHTTVEVCLFKQGRWKTKLSILAEE